MIRLAVVATSPLVQAGLESLMGEQADVQIVQGTLASGDGGAGLSPWERVAALAPDVVLWAPASGVEVLATLEGDPTDEAGDLAADGRPAPARDGANGLPALVVVADLAPADVLDAVRAGARAVLPTASGAAAVAAAVQAAASGLVTLRPVDADALLARAADSGASSDPSPADRRAAPSGGVLSAREGEVLALLAEGLANKQIAGRLAISEHTVKAHVAAIFAKLHAGTRAEAVVTAARRGLLML
jgi:DNA-binding NarL/FixJ family response regulator